MNELERMLLGIEQRRRELMKEQARRAARLQRLRRLHVLILLLMALSLLALAASSAHAVSLRPVQPIAVSNDTRVPAARIAALERSVQIQVNRQLDAYWYGRPHIRFVAPGTLGAWTVTIVTGRKMVAQGYCGYHGPIVGAAQRARRLLPRDVGGPRVAPGVTPYAVVGLVKACDTQLPGTWSIVFSHEVMEMVVDPTPGSFMINGQWPEVGDPVNGVGYQLLGVRVSDFVTPSFFWNGKGRYDKLGILAPRLG